MAKAALLDRVAHRRVHRMRGELGRDEGARSTSRSSASLERFDLVLLGLGPDGHVASLYPEQPTLDETERKAVGAEAKLEPFVDRITLTLPMLRARDEVLFLVTGADKADAARARVRGRAVARDAGQPRARGRRPDDRRARRGRSAAASLSGGAGRRIRDAGRSTAASRCAASAWSTSTVSATGTSSRKSLRSSNEARMSPTASAYPAAVGGRERDERPATGCGKVLAAAERAAERAASASSPSTSSASVPA